jgi:N-acetylmuramoyl-L-alanine amidase
VTQQHTVQQGECLHSISSGYGFTWEKVWNHPDNSDLRSRRGDAQVLMPGDVVTIPDKELKEESRADGKCHRFKRKGVPAKIRIQIKRNDEPRANVPYRIDIDGRLSEGTTDGNGLIELDIPPDAAQGQLFVGPAEDEDIYELRLGTVDPVDTEQGARDRLFNLGYDTTLAFAELLREFQTKAGLQSTGQLDDATQDKLKEAFGE